MVVVPAKMGRSPARLARTLAAPGRGSRAELAKSLGMSQPTAGIVDALLAGGVFEEVWSSG